ncbi:MAG: sigma-70 family RNA polymerase sigma factor [Myxococcaceae bacterium]
MDSSSIDAERWWSEAREAWPELKLSRQRYLAHVALHQKTFRGPPQAADLYLAAACLAHEAAALKHLELLLKRFCKDDDERAELLARLVTGAQPRLAEYAGRGALSAWLRLVAKRSAIDRARGKPELESLHRPGELSALVAKNPELSIAARHAGVAVERALQAAFASLPERDRELLQAHHLGEATHAELAKRFGVPRSTLAAWLAKAAQTVLKKTRETLKAELKLDSRELDSLIGLARDSLRP